MVVFIRNHDVSPVVNSDTRRPVEHSRFAAQPAELVQKIPLAREHLYAVVGPVRYYYVTLEKKII